jgi:hypothetical protein
MKFRLQEPAGCGQSALIELNFGRGLAMPYLGEPPPDARERSLGNKPLAFHAGAGEQGLDFPQLLAQSRLRLAARSADHIRYCSVMAAPRRLLSLMNSPMNSCSPVWKISSMRLFSMRARTARAWRWAGPWRP